MTNGDNPFEQKRGERTIIRPNPGGRRPAPAPGFAPQPGGFAPQPQPAGFGAPPQTPLGAGDDWINAQRAAQNQPPPPAFPPLSAGPLPDIDLNDLTAPNENPIMRAAGPLLMLLGRLRAAALSAPLAGLMAQVADATLHFEKDIRSAGIPEDQAVSAKYALCATADDIVQNIPTEDRHVWTQFSMLARFFNDRNGGVRFFQEVDRAKMDPLRNFPLLELLYTCLALGFQGMHRSSPNGQASLQQLQRQLYETLRQVRPRMDRELSPHWRGQVLAKRKGWLRVPVWASAGVAGLALFGVFVTLRALLSGGADVAIDHMRAIHSTEPLTLERRVFAPPPPQDPVIPGKITQLQRIRTALAAEIAAGQADASQTASKIVIRVGDLVLFPSGQATLFKAFDIMGAKIAAALDKEPKSIKVIGHTDNVKLSSVSRFPSNLQLSIERAKAVADVLKRGLTNPARVQVEGRADEEPIASNDTKEGRAKNRRVDILLEREDF